VKVLLSSGYDELEAVQRFTGKAWRGSYQNLNTAACLREGQGVLADSITIETASFLQPSAIARPSRMQQKGLGLMPELIRLLGRHDDLRDCDRLAAHFACLG